jgi:pimeloyl-ACP methyl ester carboxylesterase
MRVKVNGTTLFFDVEGAQLVADGASMRERPTVLLLHGGPGFDHSNFKPDYSQLSELAQVVYLDHRGNGRSDWGDKSTWNLDTWADDVKGFCDALDIAAPIVLGWSFGGFVAMAYATRHPGHAAKLILQSTSARLDVERIVAAFTELGGADAAAAARTFWTTHDNDSMMQYLQHCIPLYHSGPLTDSMTRCVLNPELLLGFDGEMEMDLRGGLAGVQSPVLVLAGRRDPITPVACAEEIVECLPGPAVALEVFDDSSHFIQLSEPDRFFSVVRDFIVT